MSESRLDCRGMACPNPVLKAKEAVDRGCVDKIAVLVDNAAAVENVSRFLTKMGFEVSSSGANGTFEVAGSKTESCSVTEAPASVAGETAKVAVLLATDHLGRGDDELGRKLAGNFLATLKEMGPDLWRLILVNGGVKFAVEGSESLGKLKELEEAGTTILVCGTCLNHFGLFEQKRVGETTNMLDIVTAMQVADKVISVT